MRQVLIETTGRPAAVSRLIEAPAPAIIPGHVRLEMLFSPVNPADLNYIEGNYGKKPVLPAVPGIEGVGRIVEVAAGVTGLRPGQLAIPLGPMGCWSTEMQLPAERVFALPEGLDPRQAAMLRVNPATAWGLLHATGSLPAGAWVAQNAASSAAAHCVMQLAAHLGLKTVNFVRRPESAAACLELGADVVLTDEADSLAAARAFPGFAAPALALNAVGGDSALRLMDLLSPGGTLVTYGAMGRQPVKVPNGFLIFKDVRLQGFWLTRWMESAPASEVHAVYRQLADLMLAGKMRQPVAAEYPLEELSQALEHAAAAGRGGKVLLRLSS